MGVSRSNSGGFQCRMVLIVVWVFGLAGCQTQPTPSLETPQKWSKGSSGGYINNGTGEVISRNEYGKLVAAESYYSLLPRDPGRPYCPL